MMQAPEAAGEFIPIRSGPRHFRATWRRVIRQPTDYSAAFRSYLEPRSSAESAQLRATRCEECNYKRLDVMPSKRHDGGMKTSHKRATVYFDASLHRALRVKAAVTERSLSEIVNAAVKQSMAEDAEDLAAFKDRVNEPNLAFEVVLKDLRQRGKL